jgi:hypothetical protein
VISGKKQDLLIEPTLAVCQPRTKRELSDEDAREIVANVTGFFAVLGHWAANDQDDPVTIPADHQPCQRPTAKTPPTAAGASPHVDEKNAGG